MILVVFVINKRVSTDISSYVNLWRLHFPYFTLDLQSANEAFSILCLDELTGFILVKFCVVTKCRDNHFIDGAFIKGKTMFFLKVRYGFFLLTSRKNFGSLLFKGKKKKKSFKLILNLKYIVSKYLLFGNIILHN